MDLNIKSTVKNTEDMGKKCALVALLSHIRMNLTFPDNHSKGVVEVTVRQKKEIDSELTTQRIESQIGSKSKVK